MNAAVAANVPMDAAGRFHADVFCRQCEYNLRGLTLEDDCPECGTSIHWSIVGNMLRYCDPYWVATLSRGMWLLLTAILLGIAATMFSGVLMSALGSVYPAQAMGLLAPLLSVWGIWRLTTPEPSNESVGSAFTVRALTRVTCVLFLSIIAVLILFSSITPAVAEIMPCVFMINLVVGLVGFVCLLLYARGLALRLPNLKLAKQTLITMWLYVADILLFVPLSCVTFPAWFFVMGPINPTGPGNSVSWLIGIFCGFLLIHLILLTLAVGLVIRYCIHLSEAARQAERTWMHALRQAE